MVAFEISVTFRLPLEFNSGTRVLTGIIPSEYCELQLPALIESIYREFKFTGLKLTFVISQGSGIQ